MIDGATRASIERADLICFPIGSFYTSVIAALLPHGVADAVADSSAPKVYVPNPPGTDPEEGGLSLTEKVVRLRETLEAGGGGGTSGKTVLDRVLLDDRLGRCPPVSELRALEAIGVEPVRAPLSAPDSGGRYDGVRLVEALLSLA